MSIKTLAHSVAVLVAAAGVFVTFSIAGMLATVIVLVVQDNYMGHAQAPEPAWAQDLRTHTKKDEGEASN